MQHWDRGVYERERDYVSLRGYREGERTCLLHIGSTLSCRKIMDDHRYIVNMHMNTVSTPTADVLG